MEIPLHYKKKNDNGIVTCEILLNVIFAFNKRAKIYKEEEKNCYLFNFAKKVYAGLKDRKLILMINDMRRDLYGICRWILSEKKYRK